MDSDLLLNFLSGPRTIQEVAEHFQVPLRVAESAVLEAVETGKVLVISKPTVNKSVARSVKEHRMRGSPSLPAKPSLKGNHGKLPQVRARKILAHLNERGARFVKFHRAEPDLLRRGADTITASELLGIKKVSADVGGRASLSLQRLILETVQNTPKPLMELQGELKVSRRSLEQLVRRGLLRTVWGPRGIGVVFKITRKGSRELGQLTQARVFDSRWTRRRPILLKSRSAL